MFLAIAVDNLATAQEMTADQEEAEALAREQKEKSAAKEATMFLPNPIMSGTEGGAAAPAAAAGGDAKAPAAGAKPGTKSGGAGQQTNQTVKPINPVMAPPPNHPPPLGISPVPPLGKPGGAKAKANNNNIDVDKMITRKVDLDYIPGLDDDLKVILPGKITFLFTNKFLS